MKKFLIIAIVSVLVIIFMFNFFKKSPGKGGLENLKIYTAAKYEFRYPSDWLLEEKEGKNFVEFNLRAQSSKDREAGKWLRLVVYSGPEFPNYEPYSENMVSGFLTIAGKKYPRVNFGSGLFAYSVIVKEEDLLFEFGYNSTEKDNEDTKIIESIIQSLKLKKFD